jgi:hypothetical protein
VSSTTGISTKENFSTGLKFKCGTDVHFDSRTNFGYILENCGEFDNKLIRFKLSETYKISQVESMFFNGEEFGGTKKGELVMCQREEQLLVARKFSKNARLMRFGFEDFSEDLGFTELKVKEVLTIYCPQDSESFIVHVEVEPAEGADATKKYFKTLMYRWGEFKNPSHRIIKISDPIVNTANPRFTHFGDRLYLTYESMTKMERTGQEPTPPSSSSSSSNTGRLLAGKNKHRHLAEVYSRTAYTETQIDTKVHIFSLGYPKIFIRNKPGTLNSEIASKDTLSESLDNVDLMIYNPL